jgi:hypothetical protein
MAAAADPHQEMPYMHQMKGLAKTMIVGQTPHNDRVELAQFPDGSWAIRKNGPTIGVWEPHEESECFRVFAMLAGVQAPTADGMDVVLVVRHNTATDAGNHEGAHPEWN